LLIGRDNYEAMYRGVENVGTARQGPDTAHVVYRYLLPPDSLPLQSYDIDTEIRCAGGWCSSMLGDYRGLLRSLVAPLRQVYPPRP